MLKLIRILLGVILIFSIAGCSFGLSGDNGINISGNETDSSITIGLDGSVVRGILADTGNATGSGQWLSVVGSGNVTTSASGSTVVITSTGGSGPVDMSLGEGHIFVGNTSGLAEGMELSGDATLNGLGELDVTWADQSQSADTANSSTDSDKLDGVHGSGYLLGNSTTINADMVDGSHASAFLAVAGTAADSDKLDGQHGSYYSVPVGFASGCYAYLSANQSIAWNTTVLINLDAEDYDLNDEFNTTTHLFTAKSAGYYVVSLSINIDPTAAGQVEGTCVLKNGSTAVRYCYILTVSGGAGYVVMASSSVVYLAVNDTLGLYGTQSIANPRNVVGGATRYTVMSIYRIA